MVEFNDRREVPSIEPGTVVQYRKVGTFRVVGRTKGTEQLHLDHGLAGRYDLEGVKCPKKYRGVHPNYWIDPRDIVKD